MSKHCFLKFTNVLCILSFNNLPQDSILLDVNSGHLNLGEILIQDNEFKSFLEAYIFIFQKYAGEISGWYCQWRNFKIFHRSCVLIQL